MDDRTVRFTLRRAATTHCRRRILALSDRDKRSYEVEQSVVANIVMAYIVIAYIVMAYIGMAYIAMAYEVRRARVVLRRERSKLPQRQRQHEALLPFLADGVWRSIDLVAVLRRL